MKSQKVDSLDDDLDSALTHKSGKRVYVLSDEERQAIHVIYVLYQDMLGQPHSGLTPVILDNVRQILYAAYVQVQIGGRLENLRERLLASVDQCPFCGFGEPSQLDHYLPRSIYGELAIYPNNLIPCCGPCNNSKRAIVPGLEAEHGQSLIHPYFQELPDLDFLYAEISLEDQALSVTFRINTTVIDSDLASKLQFQLDRLKLNVRYRKQINKFLNEQRTGILMFKDLEPEELSNFLQKSASALLISFHRNDWRVALFRSLAVSAEFCTNPEHYLGDKNT